MASPFYFVYWLVYLLIVFWSRVCVFILTFASPFWSCLFFGVYFDSVDKYNVFYFYRCIAFPTVFISLIRSSLFGHVIFLHPPPPLRNFEQFIYCRARIEFKAASLYQTVNEQSNHPSVAKQNKTTRTRALLSTFIHSWKWGSIRWSLSCVRSTR